MDETIKTGKMIWSFIKESFTTVGATVFDIESNDIHDLKERKKKEKRARKAISKRIKSILNKLSKDIDTNHLSQFIELNYIREYYIHAISGENYDIEERLETWLSKNRIPTKEHMEISSAIKQMCDAIDECVNNALLSDETKRQTQLVANAVMQGVKVVQDSIPELFEKSREDLRIKTEKVSTLKADKPYDPGEMHIIKRYVLIDNDREENEDSGYLPIDAVRKCKKLVLVGEAGDGKSYTMDQLYREGEAADMHVLYFHSNNVLQNVAYTKLVGDEVEIEIDKSTLVLIDGLDEMTDDYRKKLGDGIECILSKYEEDLYIVISSRSNVTIDDYIENGFSVCRNKQVSSEEIDSYLIAEKVDVEAFYSELYNKNLRTISQNMYFFCEIVEIWKKYRSLFSKRELMGKIVEYRLRADYDHFHAEGRDITKKLEREKNELERVAMIMQCMQRNYLRSEEINQIVDQETIILKYASLWKNDADGYWRFNHNNILEYLAACKLSEMDFDSVRSFLSLNSDNQKVKPSWYNVISFLSGIYTESDKLIEWVFKNDPEVLLEMEDSHIDDEMRTKVLKMKIDECITSKRDGYIQILGKKWIQFADNKESMELIVNMLERIVNSLQVEEVHSEKDYYLETKFFLNLLQDFEEFYGFRARIKNSVEQLAFSEKAVAARRNALRYMANHTDLFGDKLEDALQMIKETHDYWTIRYAFFFVVSCEKLEEYFDLVISSIKILENHPDHKESDAWVIEKMTTIKEKSLQIC